MEGFPVFLFKLPYLLLDVKPVYSKEETYENLRKGCGFKVPGSSFVCLDDSDCVDYRRDAFFADRLRPWNCPPCQGCREGEKREIARIVLRPPPRFCGFPGCIEEIGNEINNTSGFCRRHVRTMKKNPSRKHQCSCIKSSKHQSWVAV